MFQLCREACSKFIWHNEKVNCQICLEKIIFSRITKKISGSLRELEIFTLKSDIPLKSSIEKNGFMDIPSRCQGLAVQSFHSLSNSKLQNQYFLHWENPTSGGGVDYPVDRQDIQERRNQGLLPKGGL